jgi:hypothetical protein
MRLGFPAGGTMRRSTAGLHAAGMPLFFHHAAAKGTLRADTPARRGIWRRAPRVLPPGAVIIRYQRGP